MAVAFGKVLAQLPLTVKRNDGCIEVEWRSCCCCFAQLRKHGHHFLDVVAGVLLVVGRGVHAVPEVGDVAHAEELGETKSKRDGLLCIAVAAAAVFREYLAGRGSFDRNGFFVGLEDLSLGTIAYQHVAKQLANSRIS